MILIDKAVLFSDYFKMADGHTMQIIQVNDINLKNVLMNLPMPFEYVLVCYFFPLLYYHQRQNQTF